MKIGRMLVGDPVTFDLRHVKYDPMSQEELKEYRKTKYREFLVAELNLVRTESEMELIRELITGVDKQFT